MSEAPTLTGELGDGNRWTIAGYRGESEPCIVVTVTDCDLWLSADEAYVLATALDEARARLAAGSGEKTT